MKFKNKLIVASIFVFCLFNLFSCSKKPSLSTISFDVSCDISAITDEIYKPSVRLFTNTVDLINYFSFSPYTMGDDFYSDVDYFETKFGFDNYFVIYFEQMLNVSTTVNAYIDKNENENFVIIFEYNALESNTYLPADAFQQTFYLLNTQNINEHVMTITYKIGEKVLCTENI